MASVEIPADFATVLNEAWEETRKVPGHLAENEARFLGLLAGCVPARGTIVEIGRLNQDDIVEVEGTFYAPLT